MTDPGRPGLRKVKHECPDTASVPPTFKVRGTGQSRGAAPLLQGIAASHPDFSREIGNLDFHVKSPDFLSFVN